MIAEQLKRIADALERMAKSLESHKTKQQIIPWGSLKSARVSQPRNWREIERPQTFDDLLHIGRSGLRSGFYTKNIGEHAWDELDQFMKESGFENQWMVS